MEFKTGEIINSKINYKDKKQLEKDISTLSSNEHNEILNIIRVNNQTFSENNTGVFFNLKYMNEQTILKLINYVNYCKENKLKKKNEIKQNIDVKINQFKDISNESKFTLDKSEILEQLKSLNDKKNENFTFQNFLDKLSVTNIKSFKKNEKIVYPQLNQCKKKMLGVNERLIKICRDGPRDDEPNGCIETDSNECEIDKSMNDNSDDTESLEKNI